MGPNQKTSGYWGTPICGNLNIRMSIIHELENPWKSYQSHSRHVQSGRLFSKHGSIVAGFPQKFPFHHQILADSLDQRYVFTWKKASSIIFERMQLSQVANHYSQVPVANRGESGGCLGKMISNKWVS